MFSNFKKLRYSYICNMKIRGFNTEIFGMIYFKIWTNDIWNKNNILNDILRLLLFAIHKGYHCNETCIFKLCEVKKNYKQFREN